MKTVIVTGGSGGIGETICKKFSENGYNVVVHCFKNLKKGEEISEKLGNSFAYSCDLADESAASELVLKAENRFGKVDCLVNNAGVSHTGLFQDFAKEDYDRVFGTNILGMMNITKKTLPLMLKEHRGSIINISSIWGMCGGSCEVLYSASKAAVEGFTKALAKEVGPSGIRVNCVAPGVIDTKMNSHLSRDDISALIEETPLLKIGTPEDVAEAVYYLSSDKASFITGQILSPNGGFVI